MNTDMTIHTYHIKDTPQEALEYIKRRFGEETGSVSSNRVSAAAIDFLYRRKSDEVPVSLWNERTREWIRDTLGRYDEDTVISLENISEDHIKALWVPVDYKGKLSFRSYFGDRNNLIKQKTDYDNYCMTGSRILTVQDTGYKKELILLKERNAGLVRENRHLRNLCGAYIDFIAEFGNLKRIRAMLKSAKQLQYAIRGYQEDGNKEAINTLLSMLNRGKSYMKEHGIV